MKKFCPKSSGFTLIELLVVVSIIGILFTVGLAFYNDFNRRQIVTQAAKEFKDNLRLAQSKALAGEKPSGWCAGAGQSLRGYQLRFSSATVYKIEAVCSSGTPQEEVKSVDLPGNVFGPSGTSVLFKVLAQGVEMPAGETELRICISGFGKYYRLKITPSGEIKDEGFQSSC